MRSLTMMSLLMTVLMAGGAFSARAQATEQKPNAVTVQGTATPRATTDKAPPPAAAQKAADNDSGSMSLAEARSQIDKVIEKPAEMTAIMKKLSAEDQKQFLADVNKAISDMPASVEEKTAKFLNVNHAALKGAAEGNMATLIAETYATVPPEALTVINERFAIDLLSRDGSSVTDEQFEQMAKEVMEKVNERCEETDNGSPRCAFAILMLLRAANSASDGTSSEFAERLAETLIETLKHDEAKELARTEWIPSALGKDDRQQSYESLLASADAGRRPDLDFVLVIAGPQFLDSILHDLIGKNNDPQSFIQTRTPVLDAVENPLVHSIPQVGGNQVEKTAVRPDGGSDIAVTPGGKVIPNPPPEPEPEPDPYQWQRTH